MANSEAAVVSVSSDQQEDKTKIKNVRIKKIFFIKFSFV